jgi:hypothetical protein
MVFYILANSINKVGRYIASGNSDYFYIYYFQRFSELEEFILRIFEIIRRISKYFIKYLLYILY